MKIYVGVTDHNWFQYLAAEKPDELNFWIEVSKRIKEDYGNGKEYYAYHGKKLAEMPQDQHERPSTQFLLWHNEHVYLA